MSIFWVDDDIKSFTKPYYEELQENGYEIKEFEEPDSALDSFRENYKEFSCAIIDLMLPTGKTFAADKTELGTQTGKFLIEKLLAINNKIPIIILSVVVDREVINWADKKGIKYLKKHNTFPDALLAEVKRLEEIHHMTDL